MPLLNQHIKQGYNITDFAVFNSDGTKNTSLGPLLAKLQYTESITENHIKLSVQLTDTGLSVKDGSNTVGVLDGLKLNGTEYAQLKIEDGLGNSLNFSSADGTQLRVSGIREKIEDNLSSVFVLDLVSAECFENEQVRVDGDFDGKASKTVEKILKDYLKTPKDLHIEESLNEVPCTGNVTEDTPFSLCTSLGPRSIPTTPGANENSAGFFFFETYDGYNFKSIESLLDKNRSYKKYMYNNYTDCPPKYDGKILEYIPKTDINLLQKMKAGTYGAKVYTTNFFDNAYKESVKSANEEKLNLLGTELPQFSNDFSTVDGNFRPTKVFAKVESFGSTKNISAEKSKEKDFDDDKTLAQSKMRYNQLFTVKATITIAGDLSHRAGDLIYCDFQRVTSSKTEQISLRNSGLYTIADLSHFISARDGIYTKMNLVRDSFGRQPFK